MELAGYLTFLRRWWWLLLASFVLGGSVAYGVSTQIPPTYEAKVTLLVVQRETDGAVQLHDLQASERLANTFSRLVMVEPVLERAIDRGQLPLTLNELKDDVLSVTNPRSTQLLEIRARYGSPGGASHIANTVAEVFIDSNEAELTSRPGVVTIVERARPPEAPVAPRVTLNAALGAMLSLLAVAGLALLREYLDDTVKSGEQIIELTGLRTLARIEVFDRIHSPAEQVQAAMRPRSSVAEAYRSARTNLSYALDAGGGPVSILVTSASEEEGKTTTAANLAVVFGMVGQRTCVVSADLRRPSLHRLFGLDNSRGLTTFLFSRSGEADRIASVIQRTTLPNVSVIASGPLPPNPSELLSSPHMRELVDDLRERFDIVIVDSPPVLAVTDATVLAPLVDATVVVARSGVTRTGDLRAAIEMLALSGRPLAGVILNRVSSGARSYYYVPKHGRLVDEELADATIVDSNGTSAEGQSELELRPEVRPRGNVRPR